MLMLNADDNPTSSMLKLNLLAPGKAAAHKREGRGREVRNLKV